jgi:phosphatidylinositol alpha-1,6-mannosyltransferase
MERLVQHIAQSLADGYDLSVIGPEGCSACLPRSVKTDEVAVRSLSRFLLAAARAVWKATRRKFTLVVAGSGLTAPLGWWAARRARARFVVYLHGLDIIAPSAIYQRCWLPFLRRADLVLVNSRNTRRLAVERGIPQRVIEILHPGTELPRPDPEAGRAFRTAIGVGDRPLLLSVGRLTPRKGLVEFIDRALPAIIARCPDVLLLVIGADASDAVRPSGSSQQVRIMRSVEEAGVSDAVRDGDSGYLVLPGDYDEFADRVSDVLSAGHGSPMRETAREVAGDFNWEHFGERLHRYVANIAES